MRKIKHFLSACLLFSCTLILVSCGDDGNDNEKSQEEARLEELTKTWSLVSATFEVTQDRTETFNNLKLTLSGDYAPGGTYDFNVTGTRPTSSPWPESGKWKFGSDVMSAIIRNPAPASPTEDLPVTYNLVNNTLTIRFTCSTCDFAGGRSITGDWEFVFNNPQ